MHKGKHWSYDGEMLSIFDVYGCQQENAIYLGESRECLTKAMEHTRADTAISIQLSRLNSGSINGYNVKSVEVLYIRINEYMAQLLFHEAALSLEMLVRADEDDTNIFVPMVINSRRRIIAIRKDMTQSMQLFDTAGNPLPLK